MEDTEFSFITDRNGNILILSNEPEYIGNGEGEFDHLNVIDGGKYNGVWEKTSNGGLTEIISSDGVKRLFICSVVETTGWRLYAVVPSSSLTNPITNLNLALITLSLATLVLTAIIMTTMIKRIITQPIRHVTYTALELSRGNTDIFFQSDIKDRASFDINLNSELKKAGENLKSSDEINIMISALKTMINQLNEAQRYKLEVIEARHEKEKAETSARAKTEFLTRMSHEIRTPMNAILGMTELALREDIPKAAYEHVLTIKQAGANLLSIINDILDFSKIETGKLEIVPVNYLFSSLINDVISIIRMRVIDSQLRFAVYVNSKIPNKLFGDEIRIRQILLNVLSNAVKYTKKGYVYLTVDGEIKDDDTVLLKAVVTDTGKGIKQEDIGNLFGEFVQLDLMNNKGIEGTGLGLAITRSLVQAMDGEISVDSEYGKGSTFTIVFPQKFSSDEKIASVMNPEGKNILIYERREIYALSIKRTLENLGISYTLVSTNSELSDQIASQHYSYVFIASTLYEQSKDIILKHGLKAKIVLLTEFGEAIADKNFNSLSMPVYALSIANILNGVSDSFNYSTSDLSVVRFIAPDAKVLIVDDIKTNLKTAEGLLQPYKMHLDLCTSGRGAINAVQMKHYDLVFMDYMMPEIDGVETTRQIRTLDRGNPYYQDLPIVALTANAVSGTEEMFLENEFNDYLSKPIDTVKLNTILERWIPKEKQINPEEENREVAIADLNAPMIEGLNTHEGIIMTGGTLENYLQTLDIFHTDGLAIIKEIEICLAKDDWPLYITHVHALKSASASIGAKELSDEAKALELAGKQGDFAFIRTHNNRFIANLEALLSNISEIICSVNREGQAESANIESLQTELEKLILALNSLDIGTIDDVSGGLQKYVRLTGVGNDVENILQYILIGDYDKSVALIKALSEKLRG